MKAFKLFALLTVYYVLLFGGVWLVINANPGFQDYLPIGGAEQLINSGGAGKSDILGAVALAFVMSLIFTDCVLALWITEYGEREGMKRYMSDFNPNSGPGGVTPSAGSEPPPPVG